VVVAGAGIVLLAAAFVGDPGKSARLQALLSRVGIKLLPEPPEAEKGGPPPRTPLSTEVPLVVHFRVPKAQGELSLSCTGQKVPLHCFPDAPFCSATATVSKGEQCQASLPGYRDRDLTYAFIRTDPALLRTPKEVFVELSLDVRPRRPHR
jgi:hypothetical protein